MEETCRGCWTKVEKTDLGYINTVSGNGRRWIRRCADCRSVIRENDQFAIERTESER